MKLTQYPVSDRDVAEFTRMRLEFEETFMHGVRAPEVYFDMLKQFNKQLKIDPQYYFARNALVAVANIADDSAESVIKKAKAYHWFARFFHDQETSWPNYIINQSKDNLDSLDQMKQLSALTISLLQDEPVPRKEFDWLEFDNQIKNSFRDEVLFLKVKHVIRRFVFTKGGVDFAKIIRIEDANVRFLLLEKLFLDMIATGKDDPVFDKILAFVDEELPSTPMNSFAFPAFAKARLLLYNIRKNMAIFEKVWEDYRLGSVELYVSVYKTLLQILFTSDKEFDDKVKQFVCSFAEKIDGQIEGWNEDNPKYIREFINLCRESKQIDYTYMVNHIEVGFSGYLHHLGNQDWLIDYLDEAERSVNQCPLRSITNAIIGCLQIVDASFWELQGDCESRNKELQRVERLLNKAYAIVIEQYGDDKALNLDQLFKKIYALGRIYQAKAKLAQCKAE